MIEQPVETVPVESRSLVAARVQPAIERWIHFASGKLNSLGMAILFLQMLLFVFDVGGRFIFNRPLKGSTDLVSLMMVSLISCGLAYCAAQDGHIRVDAIHSRLPARVREALDTLTLLLSLVIIALIAWQLGLRAGAMFAGTTRVPLTDTLLIPHSYFVLIAAIGNFLLCLELTVRFFRSLSLSIQPRA